MRGGAWRLSMSSWWAGYVVATSSAIAHRCCQNWVVSTNRQLAPTEGSPNTNTDMHSQNTLPPNGQLKKPPLRSDHHPPSNHHRCVRLYAPPPPSSDIYLSVFGGELGWCYLFVPETKLAVESPTPSTHFPPMHRLHRLRCGGIMARHRASLRARTMPAIVYFSWPDRVRAGWGPGLL